MSDMSVDSSTAFARAAAVALRHELAEPRRAGRRFLMRGLHGLSPEVIFQELFDGAPTTDIDIFPDGPLEPSARIRAIDLGGGTVLIPYLVTDSASTPNSGGGGFAASLRTHFLEGAINRRVLLILASRPQETIASTTDDAATLPGLGFADLCRAISLPGQDEPQLARLIRDVADDYISRLADMPTVSWADAARLRAWIKDHRDATDSVIGSVIHQLGTYISDPDLHPATVNRRLTLSADWRANLDEWVNSPGIDLARKLAAKRVGAQGLDAVLNATTVRGLDYSRFSLTDLLSRGARQPAELDQVNPVSGALLVLQKGSDLVLWLQGAGNVVEFRLTRRIERNEHVKLRWRDEPAIVLETRGTIAVASIAAADKDGWRFGWLELTENSATIARYSIAAVFDDRELIAVEGTLDIDPARGGFNCSETPMLAVWNRDGKELGAAELEEPGTETDELRQMLRGTFSGIQVGPVPVLPTQPAEENSADVDDETANSTSGEFETTSGADTEGTASGTPETHDDDLLRGPAGGRGEYPPASPEQPSLAHAMRAFREPSWPAEPSTPAPNLISARFGSIALRVVPHADGVDLLPAETLILQHPEWCMFAVDGDTCSPLREFPVPEPAWASELEAFLQARAEYFRAASEVGSTYALDPRGSSARQYTASYRQLLDVLPRDATSRAEYDALLLVDRTTIRGIADLLISPTAPLTVSWHAALADRFATLAAAGDKADRADVNAFTPQHLLPLILDEGSWYEARTSPGALLWRRYVSLASSAPGALERNASFMAERIAFFLSVNPNLNKPDTTLAVTFSEPGDGLSSVDALRRFFQQDRTAKRYRRPRIRATLTGASREARSSLNTLLSAADNDVDRIVRTRAELVVTERNEPPEFSSLAFMFRSPGSRGVRPVRLDERASTSYGRGLAASLGRVVVPDAEHVFATGTFCAAPDSDATDLEAIQYRSLELVGGQGGERLEAGWTRMVAATAMESELSRWYDKSAWVVHLDRLIGLEAFANADSGRTLLEYEEGADPSSFGYDGITGTRYVEPYLAALRRSLAGVAAPERDGARALMRLLEAVSGRWALQIVQRPSLKVLERAGTACAIRYLTETEQVLAQTPGSFSAVVALEEIVPGFPEAGIPRRLVESRLGRGPMCDDLLVLTVLSRDNMPPLIQALVIEVKFWQEGGADYSSAADQVEETISWLSNRFDRPGSFADLRGRDLAELIRSASTRNSTFGLAPALPSATEAVLQRISTGDYELAFGHWREGTYRRGLVAAVEHRVGGGMELSQLNATNGPIDLVSIRQEVTRPALEMMPLPSTAAWVKITLQPPIGAVSQVPVSAPSLRLGPPSTHSTSGGPSDSHQVRQPHSTEPPASEIAADELTRYSRRLDDAFARYGLTIEPFRPGLAQVGPSVIRFRTRALGRLSITDVERRGRDISREVGAPGEVSIGDVPGFITVDVPRANPEPVPLATALAALDEAPQKPGALSFVTGIAPSGEVRIADLARLPHLLVAGATGSGKSVFLRGMLVELLRARNSDQLRLMIIDPKRLDFAPFARVPHLEGSSIISDPAEALQALQSTLVREIDWRQSILADAGVSSAAEFYESGGLLTDLPQLVILVDEFADLVLAGHDRRQFSELVQRYAQLTRAFGIFLVLATQRPSVDVITGSIKTNLSARIAFSLPSTRDSMTILDKGGAEDLLGNGDLLFYRNGRTERLQAPLATLADVREALA